MNKEAYLFLQHKLAAELQEDYPCTSRVHKLRSFGPNYYVKRDDELGFGISGSKYRKYRTLIPYLKSFKEILVIGGPFSNHVLGISQLLLENSIQPTLFLKGNKPLHAKGNFFFLQKLIPSTSIHWISNIEWKHIHQITADYANGCKQICILPEGGAIFPAFLGALTLSLDILRNEKELNVIFDHIFLDVGTGFGAAALLLALAFIEKKVFCHFLCVAGNVEKFRQIIKVLHNDFQTWLGFEFPLPENFSCYLPAVAKSFGATNTTMFASIYETARSEGFFLDPIYSGKLFYHVKHHHEKKKLNGNVLIIHSGGALSLTGFFERPNNDS